MQIPIQSIYLTIKNAWLLIYLSSKNNSLLDMFIKKSFFYFNIIFPWLRVKIRVNMTIIGDLTALTSIAMQITCTNTWWYTLPGKLRCRARSVSALIYGGRVTHICDGRLSTVGLNNGLSPGRCQASTWTSAVILLIGPLGTNFNRISYIFIQK